MRLYAGYWNSIISGTGIYRLRKPDHRLALETLNFSRFSSYSVVYNIRLSSESIVRLIVFHVRLFVRCIRTKRNERTTARQFVAPTLFGTRATFRRNRRVLVRTTCYVKHRPIFGSNCIRWYYFSFFEGTRFQSLTFDTCENMLEIDKYAIIHELSRNLGVILNNTYARTK